MGPVDRIYKSAFQCMSWNRKEKKKRQNKNVLKIRNSPKESDFFFILAFFCLFLFLGLSCANRQIPWYLTFGGYFFLSPVPFTLAVTFPWFRQYPLMYIWTWPDFTGIWGHSRCSCSRNANHLKVSSGFGLFSSLCSPWQCPEISLYITIRKNEAFCSNCQ